MEIIKTFNKIGNLRNKLVLVLTFSLLLVLTSCTTSKSEDLFSACSKLQNNVAGMIAERDTCFNGLAYVKNDFRLCKEMSNENIRSICYYALALRNNNPSLCESMISLKDSCYLDLARIKKDPTLCDKIKEEYYKNNCQEELIVK